MAGNYPDYANLGTNLKTSFNLDVQKLNEIDVTSDAFKELLRRLYQDLNSMQIALNNKQGGLFPQSEIASGGQYFATNINSATGQINLRQEFIKVIDCGALTWAGPFPHTFQVAHGITTTDQTQFTFINGSATQIAAGIFSDSIPLPYVSAVDPNGNIEIWVDDTYVNIRVAQDWSAYTKSYVILKYLKN